MTFAQRRISQKETPSISGAHLYYSAAKEDT